MSRVISVEDSILTLSIRYQCVADPPLELALELQTEELIRSVPFRRTAVKNFPSPPLSSFEAGPVHAARPHHRHPFLDL